AAAAAAEARVIATRSAGCTGGDEEQAKPARRAVIIGNTRGDDDLARGIAIEHRGLVTVEAPAVSGLCRHRLDLGEIETRRAFRMRESKNKRTIGDFGQDRLLLRV